MSAFIDGLLASIRETVGYHTDEQERHGSFVAWTVLVGWQDCVLVLARSAISSGFFWVLYSGSLLVAALVDALHALARPPFRPARS
jgi:hypothetical protein